MVVVNWSSTTYPVAIDTANLNPDMIDLTHEVMASHVNSLKSSILAIQSKLGITNSPITGLGGVSFSALGKAANPGAVGSPTIWADNSGGPGFILTYTDDLGIDYPLLTGASLLWQRGGTVLSPLNAGDAIQIASTASAVTLSSTSYVGLSSAGSGGTGGAGVQLEASVGDILISATGSSSDVYVNSDRYIQLTYDVDDNSTGVFQVIYGTASPTTLISCTSTGSISLTAAANQDISFNTSGAGADISLLAVGGDLLFSNVDRVGSTYSSPMPFASATAEWDDFVTNFGDGTSILDALNTAYSSVAGVTLDTAYNGGSSITVDSSAVTLTVPNLANNTCLDLIQNDTTNGGSVLRVANNYDSLTPLDAQGWSINLNGSNASGNFIGSTGLITVISPETYVYSYGTSAAVLTCASFSSTSTAESILSATSSTNNSVVSISSVTSGVGFTGTIRFEDSGNTGSTWTQTYVNLTDGSNTEWDQFETDFGEVSIFNALSQVYAATTSYWDRTGTVLSPTTAGDALQVASTFSAVTLSSTNYVGLSSSGAGGTAGAGVELTATFGDILLSATGSSSDIHQNSDRHIHLNYDVDDNNTGTYQVIFGTSSPTSLILCSTAGALTLTAAPNQDMSFNTSGAGADISILAAGGDLLFSNIDRSGSTYTNAMPFASATAEWDSFVTNFGDGTSLLSALNSAYSSGGGGSGLSFGEGTEMYSSNRGDFTVTYSSGTAVILNGLPFNIAAENIVAVIRKPASTAVSEQRVRGTDLDCSWTPSAGTFSGTLTLSSSFFSATDGIEVLIDGKPKAYDIMNDANRSLVINPDSIRTTTDVFSQSSLSGPGSVSQVYGMSSSGYHYLSIQVDDLSQVTINVYGDNSLLSPSVSATTWQDITLYALNTTEVDADGSYSSGRNLPYAWIMVTIDYTSATSGAADLYIVRSAM